MDVQRLKKRLYCYAAMANDEKLNDIHYKFETIHKLRS